MEKAKKKKPDPYRRIKYLGYNMSQLPDTYRLSDLLRYAKFQLAVKAGRLMKDPIWDEYTMEELLVEFFAHQFQESEEFRVKFEQDVQQLSGAVEDFVAWADAQMKKDKEIEGKLIGESEDHIKFDPNDVMGDE